MSFVKDNEKYERWLRKHCRVVEADLKKKHERMRESAGPEDNPSNWSMPVFNGRVIAALAAAADPQTRSGSVLVSRELAAELGVEDPRAERR